MKNLSSHACLFLLLVSSMLLKSEAGRLLTKKRPQQTQRRKGDRANNRQGGRKKKGMTRGMSSSSSNESPKSSKQSSSKGKKSSGSSEEEKEEACDFGTVLDFINEDDRFTILASVLNATGAGVTLDQPDIHLTGFAPPDDAFAALEELEPGFLEPYLVPEYGIHLVDILALHASDAGSFLAEDLNDGQELPSLAFMDEPVTISIEEDGDVFALTKLALEEEIRASQVVETDAAVTCNGVVHVIDFPLIPYWASLEILDVLESYDQFSIFRGLLVTSEIDLEFFEGTVFAFTNDAFSALGTQAIERLQLDPTGQLKQLMEYHLSPEVVPIQPSTEVRSVDTFLGFPVYTGPLVVNNVPIPRLYLSAYGIVYEMQEVLSYPFTPEITDA